MSKRWTEEEYADYLRQRRAIAEEGYGTEQVRKMVSEYREDALLADCRKIARQHGWLTYHTHDARRSEEGFPDLVATDGCTVLFAELKTRTGKLTEAQSLWIEMLRHATRLETYVWRPDDLPTIRERLSHR